MGFKKTATKQNKIKKEGRAPIPRTATAQKWGGHRTDLPYVVINKSRPNKGIEGSGDLKHFTEYTDENGKKTRIMEDPW